MSRVIREGSLTSSSTVTVVPLIETGSSGYATGFSGMFPCFLSSDPLDQMLSATATSTSAAPTVSSAVPRQWLPVVHSTALPLASDMIGSPTVMAAPEVTGTIELARIVGISSLRRPSQQDTAKARCPAPQWAIRTFSVPAYPPGGVTEALTNRLPVTAAEQ